MIQNQSEEDFIEDIRECAQKVEGPLSIRDYSELGEYSPDVIRGLIGSWNDIKDKAGLEINSTSKGLSNGDLLDQLSKANRNCQGVPTIENFENAGRASYTTLYRRFGSFDKAKKEAGITGGLSEIDVVRLVRKHADAETTFKEFSRETGVTRQKRMNRTGTWAETLQKAGYEAYEPRSVERDCDFCGDVFERGLKDEIESDRGFCSRDCFHAANRGEEHPLWKGGGTAPLYMKIRDSIGDRTWESVRGEQIEEECECCSSGEGLVLHHIVPVMSGGTNGAWNLMTLCRSCHAQVEKKTKEFTSRLLCPYEMSYNTEVPYVTEVAGVCD